MPSMAGPVASGQTSASALRRTADDARGRYGRDCAVADPAGLFVNSVAQLIDRIDCRLAENDADREAIFRLRYEAYRREGAIPPRSLETFSDPYDETDNVWLFGLYLDEQLASSIRIHVASRRCPQFPSF